MEGTSVTSRTVLLFSPSKEDTNSGSVGPLRQIQPSPEKGSLFCTTAIVKKGSLAGVAGSGFLSGRGKSLQAQFDIELGQDSKTLQDIVRTSKRIVLEEPLVVNGLSRGNINWQELFSLFDTTYNVEVSLFLIIRVRNLPPKPWPLSVGGLPLHLTTREDDDAFRPGESGRGPRMLPDVDLIRKNTFSNQILEEVVHHLQIRKIQVKAVYWLGGVCQITVAERVGMKVLPGMICSAVAYYKFTSECYVRDPSAFGQRTPAGIKFDDTLYANSSDALLRPGVMLSSSIVEGKFLSTSSGILVADSSGALFVTVATHGFQEDGLIYHPNPQTGIAIGHIVKSLPGTDISFAKLNHGLRYINEFFGTKEDPRGTEITGISQGEPPELRNYYPLVMNSPFSSSCDGLVQGIGHEVPEDGSHKYIKHEWVYFENGDQPWEGSCGSPILTLDGKVAAIFRYKMMDKPSGYCLAVAASVLSDHGYHLVEGQQEF